VPNTVPTPHIEALFAVARVQAPVRCKPLETSNNGEPRTTTVPTANLLILRAFTIRNQQVSGSSPEGGSIYVACNHSITGRLPIDCAAELSGVGTQAGTQEHGDGRRRKVNSVQNGNEASFRADQTTFAEDSKQ